jgi:poly(hydroxyalkanoate) granule-associated protein
MPKTTAKKAPARRAPRKAAASVAAPSSRPSWPSALAKAQQESANLFESIMKQGQRLEQRTKQAAVDTAAAARGAATAKAKEMQQIAGGTWDKLEQVFEDRVARALSKLGIYTQNDIQRLADRVDQLSAAVNELLKANGAAAKRTAKRAKKS